MNLYNEDLCYWLLLAKTSGLTLRRCYQLLKLSGCVKDIFERKADFYHELGLPANTAHQLQYPNWKAIQEDLDWLSHCDDHSIVTLTDPRYPSQLLNIQDPPLLLYVKGSVSFLKAKQVALVGSRKPTPEGREIAYDFARRLGELGIVTTSGLASGIDTAAHQGALATYATVAVVGTGITLTYPAVNRLLAEKIGKRGAIVSEFNLRARPLPHHFPIRNRLISGLSLGTCIIEANDRSGSLITANYAAEQGREVFAVPGSIRNPRSRGCHHLIKQGAALVTMVDDIIAELGLEPAKPAAKPSAPPRSTHFELEEAHRMLLECIGYEPAKIDILVERSNLPARNLTGLLLDLEVAGLIVSEIGGYRRAAQ